MALSREISHLFIARAQNHQEASIVFLGVSDYEIRQLKPRLESAARSSSKGQKLPLLHAKDINSLNEKLFRDVLSILASNGRVFVLGSTFTPRPAQKEAALMEEMVSQMLQSQKGMEWRIYAQSAFKKPLISKVLKKAHLPAADFTFDASDHVLMETAAMIASLLLKAKGWQDESEADHSNISETEKVHNEDRMQAIEALQEVLKRHHQFGKNFRFLQGDLFYLMQMTPASLKEPVQKLIQICPEFAQESLLFDWFKKKANKTVLENAILLAGQGLKPADFKQIPLKKLSAPLSSQQAKELMPKPSFTNEMAEDLLETMAADSILSSLYAEDETLQILKREENYKLFLQDLRQTLSEALSEPKSGKQKTAWLMDYDSSNNLKIYTIKDWAFIRSRNWGFESEDSAMQARIQKERQEILRQKAAVCHIPNAKENKALLTDLAKTISQYGHALDVYAPADLARKLRYELAWQNHMGALYCIEEQKELFSLLEKEASTLKQLALEDLSPVAAQSPWMLLGNGFESIQPEQLDMLSGIQELALQKNLALAFSKGLDPEILSLQLDQARSHMQAAHLLRMKTWPYLFGSAIQKYLYAQRRRPIAQLDLLARQSLTLSKMKRIADALDQGLEAAKIANAVYASMSLRKMDQVLSSMLFEKDCMENFRHIRFKSVWFLGIFEIETKLGQLSLPAQIFSVNLQNQGDISRFSQKFIEIIENERVFIPIIYKYIPK